jgi:hypothetical protein
MGSFCQTVKTEKSDTGPLVKHKKWKRSENTNID